MFQTSYILTVSLLTTKIYVCIYDYVRSLSMLYNTEWFIYAL